MEFKEKSTIKQLRSLAGQLHDLGNVDAPKTILPNILERLGLSDAYAPWDSPIGQVFVAYNGTGVSSVMHADSAAIFEREFQNQFGHKVRRVEELPAWLSRELCRPWTGKVSPTLPLDLRGVSDFGRAVLHKAREIPAGEMRSYGWIAREIGRPKATRAVGSALGRNPIPLLIPCHRVGQSDGRIGQYGLGPAAKRMMLAAEGVDVESLERLANARVRFSGSDTTKIYCFPTCRNARRISPSHQVSFPSLSEAAKAGYRPCQVCRPA
jgi:O-6-methylguanine DNA methyltransferase